MFNINELLLFGLPIIFATSTLIVPFILVPMASFAVIVYGAIATGLVNPVGAIVDWMTPPLISGYLATQNSFGGVVLQLIVLSSWNDDLSLLSALPGNQKQPEHSSFTKGDIEHATFKTFVGDVGQNMTETGG